MTDYTIGHEYTLPSNGKVYSKDVNPLIKLRSMTTVEEMKRLNHTDKPYFAMSEIIDDCLVEKPGISAYDMSLPDYQYLFHKLRVVTYGPDYKISALCPYCGSTNTHTIDLDAMKVTPFDSDVFAKYQEFELPVAKKRIKLRMQTPRILDSISQRTKQEKRDYPSELGDPAFLFTLESLIDTIDGNRPELFRLTPFIKKLSMKDTNYILKSAQKLNMCYGLDMELVHICPVCGLDYKSSFRTTSEFFGPSID